MRSLLLLEEAELTRRAAGRCAATRSSSSRSAPERGRGASSALLIAMGFRHAGQHRSKPVQLWRHGETRILVNHEPPCDEPAGRRDRGRERRPDPLRRRAPSALLAPLLPRDRAPGRGGPRRRSRRPTARRCSSAAPTTRRLADRLPDRRRAGRRRRRAAPASTTSRSRSRSTSSTRRRCSTARCSGSSSRTAPSSPRPTGSCAAAPRATPTAACASRSASRWSAAAAPSSSTSRSRRDDVFAAAEAMRERGVPLLTDPRQLLRRPRGAHGARRRTRSSGCASSASSTTRASAASCCTSTPRWSSPSLFFEVLERRGGYDGYGAANSPVRMAAQIR